MIQSSGSPKPRTVETLAIMEARHPLRPQVPTLILQLWHQPLGAIHLHPVLLLHNGRSVAVLRLRLPPVILLGPDLRQLNVRLVLLRRYLKVEKLNRKMMTMMTIWIMR